MARKLNYGPFMNNIKNYHPLSANLAVEVFLGLLTVLADVELDGLTEELLLDFLDELDDAVVELLARFDVFVDFGILFIFS